MDQTEFDSRILSITSRLDDIIEDRTLDFELKMRKGVKLYEDMEILKDKIAADKDSDETSDRIDQFVEATRRVLVEIFNITPEEIETLVAEYYRKTSDG